MMILQIRRLLTKYNGEPATGNRLYSFVPMLDGIKTEHVYARARAR
jgi:hypothetical protein